MMLPVQSQLPRSFVEQAPDHLIPRDDLDVQVLPIALLYGVCADFARGRKFARCSAASMIQSGAPSSS